jgi:2-keto-4-pentenoate hydratase/2-oxohepta-3-ene-1,7-dioic acid hydratase in catechol pathway
MDDGGDKMPEGRVRFRDGVGSVREGCWSNGKIYAAGRTYNLEEVNILAPTSPSKIVCVGLNYQDHVKELGREIPSQATLFLKPPNAVTGPNTRIKLPADSDRIDPEAELGVIIGKQCRNVDSENASKYIEGLTCMNDLSDRSKQFTDDGDDLFRGKTFDGAAPIGPIVAPIEQVPDDASIELRVNGERRQHSSIDQLIFGVDELLAEISGIMTLEPGDVISTGTPGGVAPIAHGDQIDITIEGIGTLSHSVHQS